jgi:hypothetical protein
LVAASSYERAQNSGSPQLADRARTGSVRLALQLETNVGLDLGAVDAHSAACDLVESGLPVSVLAERVAR